MYCGGGGGERERDEHFDFAKRGNRRGRVFEFFRVNFVFLI